MNSPTNSTGCAVDALLPAWYTSDRVFAAEQASIFSREWTVVGPQSALHRAGSWLSTMIAGKPVVVVRAKDGELYGHINVCRHRAASLVDPHDANGRCTAFSCPYHGWVYELDGSLRAAPGFDDSSKFVARDFSLTKVQVATWNGLVFACLDLHAPQLEVWLGDIVRIAQEYMSIEELEFHSVVTNDGHADWKSYSDNSAEGYHLEYVHPALSKAVAPGADIRPYENGRFIGFDVSYRNELGGIDGRGFWVYKFPGLLLHFSDHGFNMERVIATAPGRSRMQRWFWIRPGDSEACATRAIEASSQVMAEDLAVCESVQRNLESGAARPGVLSAQREPGTIYFQQLVREALEGIPDLP